jgi:hypothetical protein
MTAFLAAATPLLGQLQAQAPPAPPAAKPPVLAQLQAKAPPAAQQTH